MLGLCRIVDQMRLATKRASGSNAEFTEAQLHHSCQALQRSVEQFLELNKSRCDFFLRVAPLFRCQQPQGHRRPCCVERSVLAVVTLESFETPRVFVASPLHIDHADCQLTSTQFNSAHFQVTSARKS